MHKLFCSLLSATFCLVTLNISAQPEKQNLIAEIPFAFDHDVVIVQVKINGKGPYNFIFDTGSDVATIDTKTANEIGLDVKAYGGEVSGGGSEKNATYVTKINQFTVDKLILNNIQTVVVDFSKSSEILGKPLDGVIGHQFFKNRVVQFNYQKHVIYVYKQLQSPYNKTKLNNASHFILPFILSDYSPIIKEVYINGKKVKTVIDTGGGGGYFAIMPETIENLKLQSDFEMAEEGKKSAGANGIILSRKGKIKSLKVGNYFIESPTVIFYPKGVGKDNRKFGGAIGNTFLKDFNVTFDYIKKNVLFEKF